MVGTIASTNSEAGSSGYIRGERGGVNGAWLAMASSGGALGKGSESSSKLSVAGEMVAKVSSSGEEGEGV